MLDASTGAIARHERLSIHAGFDRWQHVLESRVRVELCWGCVMPARRAKLNMPGRLRRFSGARDMTSYTLSLHIMFHAHVFIKALSKRVPLQKKRNVHLESWRRASRAVVISILS